jgi:hypothetical protein
METTPRTTAIVRVGVRSVLIRVGVRSVLIGVASGAFELSAVCAVLLIAVSELV